MDLIVTPSEDGASWAMADLLGRAMGRIEQMPDERFEVRPDGQAVETMAGMKTGPYVTLDAALAEIEKHTRGTCRRHSGQDQP